MDLSDGVRNSIVGVIRLIRWGSELHRWGSTLKRSFNLYPCKRSIIEQEQHKIQTKHIQTSPQRITTQTDKLRTVAKVIHLSTTDLWITRYKVNTDFFLKSYPLIHWRTVNKSIQNVPLMQQKLSTYPHFACG